MIIERNEYMVDDDGRRKVFIDKSNLVIVQIVRLGDISLPEVRSSSLPVHKCGGVIRYGDGIYFCERCSTVLDI